MFKVGIVGCGGVGSMHASCYEALEGVKLAAVASTDEQQLKEIGEKYKIKTYFSAKELIFDPELDIIDICLPTFLHTEYAIMAMEAGKNVFIEKPVCLTPEEADKLLDAQKRTGAKVQVGHVVRFWDEYVWLKNAVENKTYGNLISVNFTRLSPLPAWSWNNWFNDHTKSGSMALDMHIHDTDFIRYMMNAEPDSFKTFVTRTKAGVIDYISTSYNFGDVLISAEACWAMPGNFPFKCAFTARFEDATAVFDTDTLTVYKFDGSTEHPEMKNNLGSSADTGINVSNLGPYYNELKYFIDKLSANEPIEVASLEEAAASLKLVLNEIQSVGGVKI